MEIIDIHCHVYPASIGAKATAAINDFYNVEPEGEIGTRPGDPETLLARQKAAGITLSVIHSAAVTPRKVPNINRFIAKTAGESKGKFLGFGTLHPYSETLEEDIAGLCQLGLKGVKLHPDMQGFSLDDPATIEMVKRCGGAFLFLLHTGDARFRYSNPPQLEKLLEACPETTFIGGHMAGYTIWQEATKRLAGRFENLYVDLSSTSFAVTAAEWENMIRAYGTDRVLYGTDFPMWDPKSELEKFLALPFSQQEQADILYNNSARLLHL